MEWAMRWTDRMDPSSYRSRCKVRETCFSENHI
jgi:hypothetical protein